MNLIKIDDISHLCTLLEDNHEHQQMLQVINTNLPAVAQATKQFGKSQSQLMDNMLTVSHFTPLRNIRQMLAEIEKTTGGLREAYFNNKKTQVKIKKLQRQLEQETDELEKELLEIKIQQKLTQIQATKPYVSGAIRKITNYMLQIENVKTAHNINDINELDFEVEEEKYHIAKAFEQALCAARSHGGWIDEGNQIYLHQLGINGGIAQRYVSEYLNNEAKLISEGKNISHNAVLNFLNDMVQIFSGCTKQYAQFKGMTPISNQALLNQGDTNNG